MATIQKTATSYPTSYTTNGSINGNRYKNAIGKGSDTSAVSGNDYANSSGSTAYIAYAFTFDIPESATIESVECTVKGHLENTSKSTAKLQLYAGSTAKGSSTNFTTTSAQIVTLTTGTWSRSEIDSMALRFTIGYYGGLVNGATVEVTYTYDSITYTVTSSVSGEGTISPSSSTIVEKDSEYLLTITPTDKSKSVSITKNGTDVTSDLVPYFAGGTVSTVLGEYNKVSGSWSSWGSGEDYFTGIVGNGVDASQTTSNYYADDTVVFTYNMGFSNIPSNATISRVYCEVNGHAESSSNSNEYMCVQLKSGSTDLSEQINFKSVSTSNTTITLEATTLPTVSQLASMVLECTLGYYGGAINGATCYVVYEVASTYPEYYAYTFTVTGDTTIAVTIGGASASDQLYIKISGSWVEASAVYKKVNGAWVEQSDLTTVFDNGVNYKFDA